MNKTPVIIVAIIALIAGIWFGQTTNAPTLKPESIQGAIYPQAKELNDFDLSNHLGKSVSKADLMEHWSLIFIGYTHCPDICPTTLAVMSQVHEFMTEQNIQPPEIIFLSVDPQRDTVEKLKPYLEYFNKDFTGLTGSIDEITKLSLQLNVMFRKAAGSSGDITKDDYLMDHSSALMLINPEGNLQSILTAPHTPATIIESILKSQVYYDALKS